MTKVQDCTTFIRDAADADLHKPEEIPQKITRTVWLAYGIGATNGGRLFVDSFIHHTGESASLVLEERVLEFTVKLDAVNIRGKLISNLEEERETVLAENHMRLKTVQDKIDQILAIEYKPDEQLTGDGL
jgi:hypothetical protein